eukprot:IDg19358t1
MSPASFAAPASATSQLLRAQRATTKENSERKCKKRGTGSDAQRRCNHRKLSTAARRRGKARACSALVKKGGICKNGENAMRARYRRKALHWKSEEIKALLEGVRLHGVGKWAVILHSSSLFDPVRTPVDLKDKWRNLLRSKNDSEIHVAKSCGCPCFCLQAKSLIFPNSLDLSSMSASESNSQTDK